jgi:hypothetical protein
VIRILPNRPDVGRQPIGVLSFCAAIILTLAVLPTALWAEEGRVLGGYRFIPSATIPDPFITTHFRNTTGLASASNVDIPLLVLEGPPPDTLFSLEGNFLFVTASAEYQHAVHKKVAVRVAGGGASRVGTSGEALLSQGVTATFGGTVGTTIELWRDDAMLLSGEADLGFGNTLLIDILKFAEDVIDKGIRDASILNKETGVKATAGLRYAWAFNHWSGITAIGSAGYTNADARGQRTLWRIGATYSADFGQRGNKPIGLLAYLGADRSSQRVLQADAILEIGLGVYYTGHEDFNIGVEFQGSRMPLQNWDIVVYPSTFTLALHYYF